ncbi:unnamed protein product [Diatraea saccharalis]|uniref:THAP-type domain-containing protein n=1 Tax=Diatraea saccharalis TaxID=40085 RepID=A0A9N9QXQ3_9NEOP|nr:unnamed protein product [Diatraea saccharalis]
MVSCVVNNCKNCSSKITKSKNGISFHRFPRDNIRRKQWELAVNREAEWCSTSYSAVCSEHFEASDFYLTDSGLRKLSLEAVPSINISPCQEQKPTICDIEPVLANPLDSDEVTSLRYKVKRLEVIAENRKKRLIVMWQQKKKLEKKLEQMKQIIKHMIQNKQTKRTAR